MDTYCRPPVLPAEFPQVQTGQIIEDHLGFRWNVARQYIAVDLDGSICQRIELEWSERYNHGTTHSSWVAKGGARHVYYYKNQNIRSD